VKRTTLAIALVGLVVGCGPLSHPETVRDVGYLGQHFTAAAVDRYPEDVDLYRAAVCATLTAAYLGLPETLPDVTPANVSRTFEFVVGAEEERSVAVPIWMIVGGGVVVIGALVAKSAGVPVPIVDALAQIATGLIERRALGDGGRAAAAHQAPRATRRR
jgi:hypothetical protein